MSPAGYLHEVGFYSSDDEFKDLICPFALDGIRNGEPVVFAYDPYKTALLQNSLPASWAITYVSDASPYATPPRALAAWRAVVEHRLALGAPRVRIAGNVPHPGYGCSYAGWDRYEVALDRALGDLPIWAPCLYDVRIAPADVLALAARRHRHLLDRSGVHRFNDSFEEVSALADFLVPPSDPLTATTPATELIDPTPSLLRQVVRDLARGMLSPSRRGDLELAVSEAMTNALVHGEPPVVVRAFVGADRVIVDINDRGNGPKDPLAGLFPVGDERAESGRGLWIAHQLDLDVTMLVADGFTLRVRAERDLAAAR